MQNKNEPCRKALPVRLPRSLPDRTNRTAELWNQETRTCNALRSLRHDNLRLHPPGTKFTMRRLGRIHGTPNEPSESQSQVGAPLRHRQVTSERISDQAVGRIRLLVGIHATPER